MSRSHAILSVLLGDQARSPRLPHKLDDGEAARAVERCRKRMERVVEVFGGRRVDAAGDRLTAVFAHADQAFQAALAMRQRVADLPPVAGIKLTVRGGLAYGALDEPGENATGTVATAATQLAQQAQAGQLLASRQARSALSAQWQKATRELPAAGALADEAVFELLATDGSADGARFVLRYGDAAVALSDHRRVIVIGRDADCDVAISDRRASRRHARIELRGDRVVLVDHSTNGTFVTLDGQPEIYLRGDECVLSGQGLISFAAPADSADADCATFA